MKKILSLAVMLSLALTMSAQFTIVYNGTDMNANDTITIRAEGEDLDFTPQFRNNNDYTESVVVALDAMSTTNIAVLNVCAGINCYGRNYTAPFDIEGGALYTQFHASITIPTATETGLFRLRIYRDNDHNAHTDLYVMILGSEASVGIDAAADNVELTAYPNPATQTVNVRYAISQSQGTLVLYNMQGAKVREQALTAAEGTTELQLEGLAAGVYMYGIEGNGIRSSMKKLVVR